MSLDLFFSIKDMHCGWVWTFFVVTYRVTNFLPKLVHRLFIYFILFFSMEKNWISMFWIPLFSWIAYIHVMLKDFALMRFVQLNTARHKESWMQYWYKYINLLHMDCLLVVLPHYLQQNNAVFIQLTVWHTCRLCYQIASKGLLIFKLISVTMPSLSSSSWLSLSWTSL